MHTKMFVKGNKLYTLTPYNRQFINVLREIPSRRWEEPYNTVKITKDKRDAIRIVHLMNRYFGVPEINIPDIIFGHAKYLKGSKFSESILFTTEYSDAFRLEAKSLNGKWNDIDKGWELNINSIPAIDKVRMLVTKYEIEYERGTEDIINDKYSRLIEAREKKQALVEMSKKADLIGIDNIDTPDGVTLYPFQQVGVNYLLKNPGNVLIADDCGLGKSAQSLIYCHNVKKYPVLIISPNCVKLNWKKEIKKFCHSDSVEILYGRKNHKISNADFVIINYDIVAYWKKTLKLHGFKIMMMDEIHYLKNSKSNRSKACFDISKSNSLIKKIGISGTPLLAKPIELLPILRILDIKHPDLESDYIFKLKYCLDKTGYRPSYNGANNLDELNVLLRETCMIRRLLPDVLPELPEKVRIPVPLEIENRTEYNLAENSFTNWYRDEYNKSFEGAAQAMAKIENLRKLAVKGKMSASIDFVENILETENKVIIFAHHKILQSSLKNHFEENYKVAYITGGMSGKDRAEQEKFFQEGDANIIICSLMAASTGINLQSGNTMIFMENTWTPSEMLQAEGRCQRIGSKGEFCKYYYLIASETIEQSILNIIHEKQKICDQTIDGLSAETGNESVFAELLTSFN